MKKIFVIDWFLLAAFVLSAATGVALHAAGHGQSHALRHNLSVAHIAVSAAFLVCAVCHVSTHWSWFKSLVRSGFGRKSKTSALLALVFLLAAATGIALLGVHGAHSGLGLWHYKIGLATLALSVWHILKRAGLLRKSLK